MDNQRNRIPIYTMLDGVLVSHYTMRELENRDGMVMAFPRTMLSLERVRRDLCAEAGEEVLVIVKDAMRTGAENARLAERLGWTDEGGLVSRLSKHVPRPEIVNGKEVIVGGYAVDIIAEAASDRRRITQSMLGAVCRRHFDFVKDDYADGHVHADNRGDAWANTKEKPLRLATVRLK